MPNPNRSGESRRYQAYLLRVWRDDAENPRRVSLKLIHSGEYVEFSNLESLFVFLHAQQDAEQSGAL